jgi:hypothetical protein
MHTGTGIYLAETESVSLRLRLLLALGRS